MQRRIKDLESCQFDVVIVGGGIFGACAAWDATQRGLTVAILDRGDFASATSFNSFKVLHGGIRYLQHLDLYRIRQSANARRTFFRIAPHLTHPLSFVVPTYGHGKKGKELLRVAMSLYDLLTFDRNRGVREPSHWIPWSYCLSRQEVLDRYPGLNPKGLTGAAVFHDGQMYNPPRLVLAFLHTAASHGAVVANYVEATKLVVHKNRVCGVEARDVLTGNRLTVRGKVVLNAAGPYAEDLLVRSVGCGLTPRSPWSRDAYFVVARPLVTGRAALALSSVTRDPEAVLSRGERHLFLVPWHHYTLVGVWHKVYEGHPDHYHVTEEELQGFLREINAAYPLLNLTLEDISWVNAGLVLFGENHPHAQHLKFAHRSRLVDHESERGLEGCLTLIGVRYTTGPCEATKAIDLVFKKLRYTPPPSLLHQTPLTGGDFEDFEALCAEAHAAWPAPVSPQSLQAMIHCVGTKYRDLVRLAAAYKDWAQPIGATEVYKAQVIYAVREEMAQKLSDVVFRRTDLATATHPGLNVLRICADLMGNELGWDYRRREEEIEEVRDRISVFLPPSSRATIATAECLHD
ncbi:MAG: glycerol-3-phosphate dehydrogenase/oxidase [Nitrospirae bacterium]|nr:MAG: glycerol-3-phosphate dehydrogenase/oxidase [Nitrospirota bacterium]